VTPPPKTRRFANDSTVTRALTRWLASLVRMGNSPAPTRLWTIAVKTPCRARWERMTGAGAVRHCETCRSNVYNLSEMTDEETEELLARSEDVCVRYYCRPDGTLVRTNCDDRPRWPSATAAGAAMALATTTAFVGIEAAVDAPPIAAHASGERVLVAMGGLKLTIKPLTPEQQKAREERRRQGTLLGDARSATVGSSGSLALDSSVVTPTVQAISVSAPSRSVLYGVSAVIALFATLLAWATRRRLKIGEPR
jgi:hypothetical protein